MLLVIGGGHSIDNVPLPVGGEVGVQLDHEALRGLSFRAIDLDFVIALSTSRRGCQAEDKKDQSKGLQLGSFTRVLRNLKACF